MPTYTSQIQSALSEAADRNGLEVPEPILAGLAETVEQYLVSQGALSGEPVNRVFPAAITGESTLIRAELRRLATENRIALTEQVLDGLTTVVEGFLVAAGVLVGVGDPGNSPEQNLHNLQERIDPIAEEGLDRDYAAEGQPTPAAAVDTDIAYEVVRDTLRNGGQQNGIRLVAGNLNDLTTIVVDFLVERGLLK